MTIKKNIFYTLTFLALIIIDQFAKYEIRTSGGFYICNPGIAFGLEVPYLYLLLFFGFVCIGLFFWKNVGWKIESSSEKLKLEKKKSHFRFSIPLFSFLLITAGALSNILDRLHYGCVIDFIDLGFWPVFNLADVYITIGAGMLLLNILTKKEAS